MDIHLPSPPKHVPSELSLYQLIKKHNIINAEKLLCAVMLVSKIFNATPNIIISEVLNRESHPELKKEYKIHNKSLFSILHLDELFENDDKLTSLDWAKFKFYVEAAKMFIYKGSPMSIKNSENLEYSWGEIKYTGNTKWVNKKSWKEVKILINDILRKSSLFVVAGQELSDINQHNDYETLKLMLYSKIVKYKMRILKTFTEQNNIIKNRNYKNSKPTKLLTLQDIVRYFLSKIMKSHYKKWLNWGDEPHTREEIKEYNIFNHTMPLLFAVMLNADETTYTPQYKSITKFSYLQEKLNIYFKTDKNMNCDNNDEKLEIQKKEDRMKEMKIREDELDNQLLLIESELANGKSRRYRRKNRRNNRSIKKS